jgi:hypothetical protein
MISLSGGNPDDDRGGSEGSGGSESLPPERAAESSDFDRFDRLHDTWGLDLWPEP